MVWSPCEFVLDWVVSGHERDSGAERLVILESLRESNFVVGDRLQFGFDLGVLVQASVGLVVAVQSSI